MVVVHSALHCQHWIVHDGDDMWRMLRPRWMHSSIDAEQATPSIGIERRRCRTRNSDGLAIRHAWLERTHADEYCGFSIQIPRSPQLHPPVVVRRIASAASVCEDVETRHNEW
jgi:hypothetical protein